MDWLVFRLGYEFWGLLIFENKWDLFVFIGEIQLYFIGFLFYWLKDIFIDGVLGYVYFEQNIVFNGSMNVIFIVIDNFIYNFYVGYNMKIELLVIVGEISI